MYLVIERKHSEIIWSANRLVDDSGDSPITEQISDHFQQQEIRVVCATFEQVSEIIRKLQDDSEWHHQITNNVRPTQEGLDLWKGIITSMRYLPRDPGSRDSGAYIADASF